MFSFSFTQFIDYIRVDAVIIQEQFLLMPSGRLLNIFRDCMVLFEVQFPQGMFFFKLTSTFYVFIIRMFLNYSKLFECFSAFICKNVTQEDWVRLYRYNLYKLSVVLLIQKKKKDGKCITSIRKILIGQCSILFSYSTSPWLMYFNYLFGRNFFP